MKLDAVYQIYFGVFSWISRPEVAAEYSLPHGSVQWAVQSLEVSPSADGFSVWLLRPYPSNGSLVANIVVDDKNGGVGATSNLNFTGEQFAWMSGDNSAREVRIPVLNASYLDSANQVRLLINSTEPPGAQHPTNHILNVTLANVGSPGHIKFSANVIETDDNPPQAMDECLVYATRAIGLGERTALSFEVVKCEAPLNAALEGTDFSVYSTGLESVWEPSQSDTRCVLRKLSRFTTLDTFGVKIHTDERLPGLESICLRPTISPATSTLSASTLMIVVRRDSDAHTYGCAKGQCTFNCSDSSIHPDDEIILWQHGCGPCNSTSLQEKKFYGRDCPVNYGQLYDASNSSEAYSACVCPHRFPSAPSRLMGKLEIRGPMSDNTVTCIMGSPVCAIQLRENSPDTTNEFVRVVYDRTCRDFSSAPPGFLLGARAKISTRSTPQFGWYYMTDPTRMAQEVAGIYQICWCQQSGTKNCSDISGDSYGVRAGLLFYSGPYNYGVQTHTLGLALSTQFDVRGVQLSSNDRVALQKDCGIDDQSQPLVARASASSRAYSFGVVGMGRVDAVPYYLCWCQPHTYRTENDVLGTINCDKPSDFVAPFGRILFQCPGRYADTNGNGQCIRCNVWEEPDSRHLVCDSNLSRLLQIVLSCFLGAICCLIFFMEIGNPRRSARSLSLRGRAVVIEDITTEGGGVIITTRVRHRLNDWAMSVPVILEHTGCLELDSELGNEKKFRVQVQSPYRLKLLEANGKGVPFQAESSSGTLILHLRNGLLHTVLFKMLPVCILILLLFVITLAIRILALELAGVEFFFMFYAIDVTGGLLLKALHKVWTLSEGGNINSINVCLSVYRKQLADWNANPKASESAPERGITAFKLYDLQDFFLPFIKLRSMYYVYPNILKPLTERFRLSYAEVAGPSTLSWFVSYYHGTPFRHFSESIRLHAVATLTVDNIEGWKFASYWICAFSTNHFQMEAELGFGDQRESSHHKALHSEMCKGTCIVMDEEALPLTRSWCLFEVLQTLQLELNQEKFQGLLLCSRTGVLNYGAATTTLSANIGKKLATLKLEDAKASSQGDEVQITGLALKQFGSLKRVNESLYAYIGSALLVCQKRVEHEFSELMDRLRGIGEATVMSFRSDSSFRGRTQSVVDHVEESTIVSDLAEDTEMV